MNSAPDSTPITKHRRPKKSELRVVLDTNALYVTPTSIGSASDLLRPEIATLIAEAKYPDLEILWYIPEVVRHERQYQMQAEALKLRTSINKIERLLGHNLALTDNVLLDHVKAKIEEKEKELGLQEIKLDHGAVDWSHLVQAAVYRRPPFDPGEKEKGFRDALVSESFIQLLEESPKSATACRLVLITSDALLTKAVKDRITGSANVSVLSNVEELKGLINTIVSDAGEDFIALLKPKASKMFFVSSDDKETLFYKGAIEQRMYAEFGVELKSKPEGTTFRNNKTWSIEQPNFSRKEARRVFWTSRIEIEVEAGITATEPTTAVFSDIGKATLQTKELPYTSLATFNQPFRYEGFYQGALEGLGGFRTQVVSAGKNVPTHRGRDTFEVLWSAEVTMSKELKKAIIENIKHVELNFAPIS